MILQLFCQEEFLRRLSLSKYKNNLVLKGGLFIYTLTKFESRATIDIDFLLRNIPNNMEDIKGIIDEINNTSTGNDFIELESRGFEIISEHRKYKGISFQIVGKIKNSRTPFNVDIGVGDIIVPSPECRSIPVQLPEFKPPEIATYSLESTIAEKFDAMLQRLELTSRMKDFMIYGISLICLILMAASFWKQFLEHCKIAVRYMKKTPFQISLDSTKIRRCKKSGKILYAD